MSIGYCPRFRNMGHDRLTTKKKFYLKNIFHHIDLEFSTQNGWMMVFAMGGKKTQDGEKLCTLVS